MDDDATVAALVSRATEEYAGAWDGIVEHHAPCVCTIVGSNRLGRDDVEDAWLSFAAHNSGRLGSTLENYPR
jgi:hypothetical protein